MWDRLTVVFNNTDEVRLRSLLMVAMFVVDVLRVDWSLYRLRFSSIFAVIAATFAVRADALNSGMRK
jgi:uncharacterized RDD family membrane protein YckC